MSYGVRTPLIDWRQIGEAITVGVVQAGKLAIGAVEGGLALVDLARDAVKDVTAATGSRATLLPVATNLRADVLPVLRGELANCGLRSKEGGYLDVTGRGRLPISMTVFSQDGKVLFFVRAGDDGFIEVVLADRSATREVEAVLGATMLKVAEETLQQQGFRLLERGGARRTFERRVGGRLERVVFDRAEEGINGEAITIDASGNLCHGNDCPNLQAVLAHVRGRPDFLVLDGEAEDRLRFGTKPLPGGAAARKVAEPARRAQPPDRAQGER